MEIVLLNLKLHGNNIVYRSLTTHWNILLLVTQRPSHRLNSVQMANGLPVLVSTFLQLT